MYNALFAFLLLTFLAWFGAKHPEKEGIYTLLLYALLVIQAAIAVYLVSGYRKKFTNDFKNSRGDTNEPGD